MLPRIRLMLNKIFDRVRPDEGTGKYNKLCFNYVLALLVRLLLIN